MAMNRHSLFALALAGALQLGMSAAGHAQDTRQYILATATTGGTYYPVGVAIATLAKVKLEPTENLSMSAISSAGSGENIKLLRENQAQFGILQALFGAWAAEGSGMLEAEGPQPHLRSISMLWVNVEHFVVTNDMVDTGTVEDLNNFDGAPFSIGARNSGPRAPGARSSRASASIRTRSSRSPTWATRRPPRRFRTVPSRAPTCRAGCR
jgi:uncharacterized protein